MYKKYVAVFLLLAALSSFFFYFKPSIFDINTTDTKNTLSISIKSVSGDYRVNQDSVDELFLLKTLESLGYKKTWTNFRLLQDTTRFEPKSVAIVTHDIGDLSEAQRQSLVYKVTNDKSILVGYHSNFDHETQLFAFDVYYDFKQFEKSGSSGFEKNVKYDTYKILYLTSLSNRPSDENELRKLLETLEFESRKLFEVESNKTSAQVRKKSLLKSLIVLFRPKIAYAACSGFFTCGTQTENCSNVSVCPINNVCDRTTHKCEFNAPNGSPIPCSCNVECTGDVAKSCSIIGSQNSCNSPDQGCNPLCLNSSNCSWSGAPDPSPPPSSSPPPSGGGGGTTCYRCVNAAACALTTSNEPCGCESCTTETSKKALYLFDDTINENGVWEPNLGEKRITSNNNPNCTNHGNVMYLAGANLIVGTNTITDSCNIGENEYPGDACQDTRQCSAWSSGSYWTPTAITTVLNVENTCFAEQTCSCGTCSGLGSAFCQSETASGSVCRQDSRYCDTSNWQYNLKSGPYAIVTRETRDDISIGAQFPLGWRPSAFNVESGDWSSTNGSCTGAIGYGLVLDQEKSCTVSPVNTDTTTAGAPISLTVTGYSTQPNESVALTLIKKQPAPATAPTNAQLNPIPPGATQSYYASPAPGRYYYNYTTNCTAGGSATPCSKQVVIDDLPVGEYYAFCALNTQNPNRCTGNPNCIHEGLGGTIDCSTSGYESCSTGAPDDNATIKVTCSPVCTPACGQDNGCGTGQFCGQSDNAPPPMPNPMSSRDIIVTTPNALPSSHYATINWSTGPLIPPNNGPTTRYELVIAKRSATFDPGVAWQTCSAPVNLGGCGLGFTTCDATTNGIPHRCVRHNTTLTYNFFPTAAISNQVNFYARAANTSCSAYTSNYYSSFSVAREYNLMQTINGTIYNDSTATGSPLCSTGTADPTPFAPPSGTTITESKTSDALTFDGVASSYSFTGSVPYSPTTWLGDKSEVQLTLPPPTDPANALVCACPNNGACQYSDISSPQADLNFFLTTVDLSAEAWWQTVTGLVYAARDAIYSNIPDDCKNGTGTNPNCVPYLITQDATISDDSARALSAGIPMSGSDDVTGGSKTVWLTERVPQALTSKATEHTQLLQEDFAYFQAKYDYANLPALNLPGDGSMPDISTDQVFKHTGDLTIQPNGNVWKLDSGQTLIIFVEGNLTFAGDFNTDDPLTDVTEGGFMAFIVDGSITFDANVGTADLTATTPTVEGVFIADQNITIDAAAVSTIKDKRFIGAGTFVAWAQSGTDGVVLNRNYQDGGLGGLDNRDYPTETFIFRPDFTLNIPDEMKSTSLFWQEVN